MLVRVLSVLLAFAILYSCVGPASSSVEREELERAGVPVRYGGAQEGAETF